MKPKNTRKRDIGFYIFIFIILISVVYLLVGPNKNASPDLTYSEVRTLFEDEQVKSFYIEDDVIYMELYSEYKDSKTAQSSLYSVSIFYYDLGDMISEQLENGTLQEYDYRPVYQAPWWMSMLPYALALGVFFVLWYIMMNRAGGAGGEKNVMKFGKARTRQATDEKKKVTFNDVAGAEEEKEELQEIVDFLKNPKKYIDLGARIPKGVLLVGPPGTGKTLLAKAVAGEAGVNFLSISGSDFVELYVGIGASRVRDLFDQAKKASPAIVFIDEIDAVGRQRGSGLGGGHDEREQTLNQLLVEMDGFSSNEGVIVMAATNRADILDNALLRPGRFDRQIYVGVPDIKGREAILRVHSRNKALGDDVNLNSVAKGTPGFTGADLENLMNEAALLAARRNKKFITMAEMDDAVLKVIAGPEKKSRVVSEKERRLTAYHEAGHAVVSYFLEHVDPVHQITIIPHGPAGGMTIYRPAEDKSFNSRNDMFERIVSCLGGRIAEELMLDDISTGASGDIQQASSIARSMVTKYGMSEKLGPISYDSSDNSIFIGRDFGHTKSYSEKVAAEIDEEVKRIFDEAYAKGREILTEHSFLLVSTAEYLLRNETMDGKLFEELCKNGGQLPAGEKAPELDQNTEPEQDPEPAIMDEVRREALQDAIQQEILEKNSEASDASGEDADRRDE